MIAVIILSLMIASSMAAPVIVAPGVQLQPAAFLTAPQLQFVQQPAFLAQTAVQQEEVQQQEQEQQQQQQQRDPNNPTTDIFLHSGFPLVQSGGQSPFTIQATPLTTVGLTSQQPQTQSAQLVAAPAQAQTTQFFTSPQQFTSQAVAAPQPVQQPQQTFATFPATFQTSSVQQSAALQAQPAQSTTSQFTSPFILTSAQQQPVTAFRTVGTPFTIQTLSTQ